jgi:hypothetical protein
LTIPTAIDLDSKYTVQLSIHGGDDSSIYLEDALGPSDLLSNGSNVRDKLIVVKRGSLPQYRDRRAVELRANFYKGQKLVEIVDCGRI